MGLTCIPAPSLLVEAVSAGPLAPLLVAPPEFVFVVEATTFPTLEQIAERLLTSLSTVDP